MITIILQLALPATKTLKPNIMTFEQALEEKKKIGETTIKDNVEMDVIVGPLRPSDQNNFFQHYRRNPDFEDEDSIELSTDGKFAVYGINMEVGFTHLRLK